MAGDPPVRVAESAPRHVLSHTEAGLRGRAGIDDADRPLSSEIPLLWQLSYPRLAGGAGAPGESEEGPAPDAGDGYGGAVSKAQPRSGEPVSQCVSVPAAGPDHRSSESGMGSGYHLHPDGSELCVPGRDHGLVLTQGAVMACIQHAHPPPAFVWMPWRQSSRPGVLRRYSIRSRAASFPVTSSPVFSGGTISALAWMARAGGLITYL